MSVVYNIIFLLTGLPVDLWYCTAERRSDTKKMVIVGKKEKGEKISEKIIWNLKYKD